MTVVSYKCPNCGAELEFDPKTQKFGCEYCASQFTKEELDRIRPEPEAADQPEDKKEAEKNGAEEAVVYSCPSCGAEIVTDATTAATFCYYCHNPVVLSGRLDGSFTPDKVVPFAFNQEQAQKKFEEWIGKKKFLPKSFLRERRLEKLTGVYFPYWLTDCDVFGRIDGQATRVRTWRSGNRRFTETSFYKVVRGGEIHFEDMLHSALSKANRVLVEQVQPFSERGMKDFSMAYLSGFFAEKRDMEYKQFEPTVRSQVRQYTESLLRDRVNGYATVNVGSTVAEIHTLKPEYALLPVWTMTFRYQNELYYYAMNGQTGKTCGKLPVSYKKLALLFAGIALPIAILLGFGGYFLL